ncbi:hypothetical protein SDC9_134123 [bioreactor metagenome]|uniref:Uncharacterized protein n=1 Tax=bioreactor metagenome TaxID=1076179 RepID=A0A645DC19_9ZZZZ
MRRGGEKEQFANAEPKNAADDRFLCAFHKVREAVIDGQQMVERMVNERGGQFSLALRQGRSELFDAEIGISPAVRDVAERVQRLPACVQMSTFPSSVFPAR